MLHHGRHGRGMALGAYGTGSARVASVLSAVRGDESSVRFFCVLFWVVIFDYSS
jgi:hypothetical protein